MEHRTEPDFEIFGEKYFSRKALSRALGLSVATLAGYATKKNGPPQVRMGRNVLYPEPGAIKWAKNKLS